MEQPITFLVAVGDTERRQRIGRELESHGSVVSATSCNEAKKAIRGGTFDALVIDAELPDGSGFGIADLAATMSPGIFCLACAESFDHEASTRALEAGAHICVGPFSTRDAAVVVEEARASRTAFDRRTDAALARWRTLYKLTTAEAELLRRSAHGESRAEMARRRRVTVETVRKQAQTILRKTKSKTFEAAVIGLLREGCAARR